MNKQQPVACAGSRQWPEYNHRTKMFFCTHCGANFTRDQLQGRDDHMPPHYQQTELADISTQADRQAYDQILSNMVERAERARDPQRYYVHNMHSRLAFRGINFLEVLEILAS